EEVCMEGEEEGRWWEGRHNAEPAAAAASSSSSSSSRGIRSRGDAPMMPSSSTPPTYQPTSATSLVSERGLYVNWLDQAWIERLLAPSLDPQGPHLAAFEPRHVSGVLWALAKFDVRPRAELLATLCERAAQLARDAACYPYASSTSAVATQSTPGALHQAADPSSSSSSSSSSTSSAAAAATAEAAASSSPPPVGDADLKPQSLSLTLWALGRLGFYPHGSVMTSLLAACEADMRATLVRDAQVRQQPYGNGYRCRAIDVAHRLWALAALGYHPGEEWLDLATWTFLTRGSVEEVSGQSCSMVIWALATLRLHHQPQPQHQTQPQQLQEGDTPAAAATHGSGRPMAAVPQAEAAPAASAATAAPTVPMAQVDAPGEEGDSSCHMAIQSSAPAAGAGAAAASAASAAGAAPTSLDPHLLLGLLEGCLERMSPQHLATVLWGLERLGVRPSEAWLQ
ncbi:hypothetical protein Agub_g13051, partial [Astrephomene gubernaculifera]